MGKHKIINGVRHVQSSDGLVWAPKRKTAILSTSQYKYTTVIGGVTYRLEQFKDTPNTEFAWFLSASRPGYFLGDYCSKLLFDAADVASAMIRKRVGDGQAAAGRG